MKLYDAKSILRDTEHDDDHEQRDGKRAAKQRDQALQAARRAKLDMQRARKMVVRTV